ncbi:LamG-like jellyroll fold domain-containing protein [Flavobacterium suzhouense]|uniref:LamG-like jellyroll fold domain-containing protein n=1 Tax=Flavobacterium suzhouense TaxID=1529638 RepID=A0ABW5NNW7_9FLAO
MIKKLCFVRWFCWLMLFITTGINAQNALDFDGVNEYVQTTYQGMSGSAARTIEAWVKIPTDNPTTQTVIADWGNMAVNGQRFTFNVLNNNLRIEIGGGGITYTSSLADNTWHHVAVTYDPTQATNKYTLYVDGLPGATGNITTATISTAAGPVRIGRRIDNTGSFKGTIDEVRIWDVARTQAEIAGAMNTEFCALPTGLKAYYKFNNGVAGGNNAGVNLVLDSASGKNGMANGFAFTGSTSNWVTGKTLTTSTPTAVATLSGPTLTATAVAGATYQWVDCNNANTAVTGATAATYTPSYSSTFAVKIMHGDCFAISNCIPVVVAGCNVNPSVTLNGTTLAAVQTGATYQWIDCNNSNTAITGATAAAYTPTAGGNYAVTVTTPDTCVTTTACTYVCALSPAVTISGSTLTAVPVGVSPSATLTYQWVDCNNANAPITGATGANYTPTIDGTFAVIITSSDGCMAISPCTEMILPILPNALNFDGSADYVQTTYTGPQGAAARTVEAWVKVPTTNTSTLKYIVDWGTSTASTTAANKFALGILNQKLQFSLTTSTTVVVQGTTTLNDNNWHHVAVTYDPLASTNKILLYVDGVQDGAGTPTTAVNTDSGTAVRIGYGVNSSGYFNGTIDEVRIWDVTRTAAEILGAKDTELCTIPSSLKAYYKFNKGAPNGVNTGQTVAPDSAGNNPGALNMVTGGFALSGTSSNWVPGAPLTGAPTATVTLASGTLTANTVAGASYHWVDCANANAVVSGATTAVFTPTVSGNYAVVITGSNGCATTSACTQVTVVQACVINNAVTLSGTTLTATQTGATYQWVDCATDTNINGATNATYTPTVSGNYKVIITMGAGCTSTSACTQVCIVNNAVTLSGTTLTATQTGATYQWVNCTTDTNISGATNAAYTPTVSGSYKVVVTMGACTVTSACTAVTVCNLTASATLSGTTLTANAVTNATYQWVDCGNANAAVAGATAQTFTPAVTGNYAVVISTPDTCTATSSCTTVTITVCNLDNTVTLSNGTLTAVQGGATYQWVNCDTNTNISGATAASYTPTASGNYKVIITAGSCTATSACTSVTVCSVNPAVTLTGTTLTATQTGATYQWVNCATDTNITGATAASYTPTASGSYKVIITMPNSCTVTSACTQVCIVNNAVTLTGTTLTATQTGATYQWVNCTTNANITGATAQTYTPTVTGDYKVIVTMGTCTATSACTQVCVVNPAVTLAGTTLTATQTGATYQWVDCTTNTNITGATAQSYTPTASGNFKVVVTMGTCTVTSACTQVCVVNSTVTLTGATLSVGQTGATYQWVNCTTNTNITGATAQTYTATASGSYKVIITMTGGCTVTSACTSVCVVNNVVTLGGNTLTAAQAGATYQWVNCATNTNITGATAQSYTPTVTGDYKVIITMGTCTATSACMQVCIINPAVTQTGITLTAAQTGATYQWINCANGNAPVAGATAATFVATATGSYAVVITMPNGCTATSACTPITICNVNQAVTVNGNTITATQTGATYQWVNCTTNTAITGETSQSFTPAVSGNYKVVISMAGGCSATSVCTSICIIDPAVTLAGTTLTATQAGATYQWVDCTNNANIAGATAQTYTPLVSGNYKVIITMGAGCTATSACTAVTVCNLSGEVTLNGTTFTATQAGATYQWVNCDTDMPVLGENAQSFTATISGNYKVIISTPDNCTITSACQFVNPCNVTAGVNNNGGVLMAVAVPGASYQWINCDNGNMPIEGETAMNYQPTMSGNYALMVTVGECSDTSDCQYVLVCNLSGEVTLAGTTLTATQADASYQWMNCDTDLPVIGANEQSFTPLTSGNYKVVISTPDNCTITSECQQVCIIDATVINNGWTLTAAQQGATYQWINCADNSVIEGETSATYVPTVTGNYAVQISFSNGCTVTSACEGIEVEELSAGSFDFAHAISVYPNPTNDRVTIDMGEPYDNVATTIINIAGQVVATQGVNNSQTFTVDLSSVARGVYFLNVQTASGQSAVLKVIKN